MPVLWQSICHLLSLAWRSPLQVAWKKTASILMCHLSDYEFMAVPQEMPPGWPRPKSLVRHTERQLHCHLGASAFWGKITRGQDRWKGVEEQISMLKGRSLSSLVLRLESANYWASLCIEQCGQTLLRAGQANTWPSDSLSVDWEAGHFPLCPLSPGAPSCFKCRVSTRYKTPWMPYFI